MLVTALIVFLQVLLIIFLPFLLRQFTVFFYFIVEIISVIAIVTLVNRNQSPSYRLAWISIVLLLPISGFFMYYLWGRSSKKRKYLDRHILRQISYGNQFLLEDKKVTAEYIAKIQLQGVW